MNVPHTGGRGLLWIGVAGALLLGLAGAAAAAPGFDLQGHRGTRALAPENTLSAFRAALAIGVNTLELDVHVTRDGQVVVCHDGRLNPAFTREAAGRWIDAPGPAVISLSLAELQRYDVGRVRPGDRYGRQWPARSAHDGERIPTLAAVFDDLRARGADAVRLNIETKLDPGAPELTPPPDSYVRSLLAVIDAHGMHARVSIESFDWRALRMVQQLAPGLPTVALTARQRWLDNVDDPRWTAGLTLADHGGSVPRMVKAVGAGTWSPYHGDLTEALVQEAHALGLAVLPWTVNEPALIERLLDWKVDGLISDYPDRVRAAMQRRGMPLPPALKP